MTNIIHETELYLVRIDDDKTLYEIVNKQTEVVEHSTSVLPEALNLCKLFSKTLENMLAGREEDVETLGLPIPTLN